MNILVIDTATEACSVALKYQEQILSRFEICPQQHSQRLLPMVDEVMKEAGISLGQLDGLGFGRGPGSFTGVRIATGMIQGLAMGADLPVVGVSTLRAMAQEVYEKHNHQRVAVAIDARMNEVYFSVFENQQGVMEPVEQEQVTGPQSVLEIMESYPKDIPCAGTGWQAYPTFAMDNTPSVLYPAAEAMLPYASLALKNGQGGAVDDIKPVYLRDKVTWKKVTGQVSF